MAFSSIPEEKPVLKTAIVREWLYAIRNFKPLGASNLFKRQGIDVLAMAFDFPVLDIPHMRVC